MSKYKVGTMVAAKRSLVSDEKPSLSILRGCPGIIEKIVSSKKFQIAFEAGTNLTTSKTLSQKSIIITP